ncbi:hypothetical protein [Rhodococcoides corynebacterioides]|uniref:hypothetical protein n=1 Tax=Rhodococcoides corynebacterioides TaxID=53972 RepID=UPI00082F68C0|nr:hypothetical protein [Rhodococcus corynebacterioides]
MLGQAFMWFVAPILGFLYIWNVIGLVITRRDRSWPVKLAKHSWQGLLLLFVTLGVSAASIVRGVQLLIAFSSM